MSIPMLSRAEIREYDRRAVHEFGVPGVVLMENAGRGVADFLVARGCQGPVAICCGRGNNGGDGFVIARHLQRRGISIALHCWQPLDQWGDSDAGINAAIATHSGMEIQVHIDAVWPAAFASSLANAAWIVDALLGTGVTGNPQPPLDQVIELMNQAPGKKLAVDVPSGLDCDTGQLGTPTFRADYTCTFVAAKPGLLVPAAASHVGELQLVDIGAPQKLDDDISQKRFKKDENRTAR